MENGELFREIQKVDPREYEIRDTGYVDVLYPVTSLRWVPDIGGIIGHDTLIASYANCAIKFWDVSNNKKDYEINERDNLGIYTMDYSRVGDKIATGGVDRIVRVYSNTTKNLICELKGAVNDKTHIHHLNRIHCVKFGTDDHIVYSGGVDGILTIHDIRQKDPVKNILGPYIIGDAIDVFGNVLLTGSYRAKDCIEIWDLRTFNRITVHNWDDETPKEGGEIVGAKFSKQKPGSVIAACRLTNQVKIFDKYSTSTLASAEGFQSMIYSIDQSHDGEHIAVGTKDGLVTVFEFH
jgi:WD40 repeat protein